LTPVASLFLLRTIVIAPFLYCTFIIYSAIRLSSRKCVINSVYVQCRVVGVLQSGP